MTPPASITEWEQLPLIVHVDDLARLLRTTPRAIARLVRIRRRGFPQPLERRPMRWSRRDLERWWESGGQVSARKARP